jgi:hypothetical protein
MDQEDPQSLPLPMEDREHLLGFWAGLGKTLGLAFRNPMAFFQRIPNADGLRTPLGFACLASLPIYLLLLLYPFMLGFMGLMVRMTRPQGAEPPFQWMALGCLGGVLVLPILQAMAILLSGLLQALLLRLWGVHDPGIPFRHDFRAWIYTHGFLVMAAWTPIGPLAMLAVMLVAGMGFARMHRAPTWKGVAATLSLVGLVVGGTLATLLLFLVLATAKARQNALKSAQTQGLSGLWTRPDMPPETVMNIHIDQARITLNALSRPGQTPETAVMAALDLLQKKDPSAINPYDSKLPAFCLGPPATIGQVGLTPLHDFHDSATRHRFKAGVSVEAWTRDGRIRRFVTFESR